MKIITAEKWFKAPEEYKKIKDGQKWLLYIDEEGATTWGPVEVEKTLHERVKENNAQGVKDWEERAKKGEVLQIM